MKSEMLCCRLNKNAHYYKQIQKETTSVLFSFVCGGHATIVFDETKQIGKLRVLF